MIDNSETDPKPKRGRRTRYGSALEILKKARADLVDLEAEATRKRKELKQATKEAEVALKAARRDLAVDAVGLLLDAIVDRLPEDEQPMLSTVQAIKTRLSKTDDAGRAAAARFADRLLAVDAVVEDAIETVGSIKETER